MFTPRCMARSRRNSDRILRWDKLRVFLQNSNLNTSSTQIIHILSLPAVEDSFNSVGTIYVFNFVKRWQATAFSVGARLHSNKLNWSGRRASKWKRLIEFHWCLRRAGLRWNFPFSLQHSRRWLENYLIELGCWAKGKFKSIFLFFQATRFLLLVSLMGCWNKSNLLEENHTLLWSLKWIESF